MQKSIIKEIQKKHIFGCIYIIIIIIFYLPYLHNTKHLFTAVWLEGKETQETTGLMGEPPHLH